MEIECAPASYLGRIFGRKKPVSTFPENALWLRLQPQFWNELAPDLGVPGDHRREIRPRDLAGLDAQRLELRDELRIVLGAHNLPHQRVDDLLRRLRRRHDPVPGLDVVARHRFRDGGNIGKGLRTGGAAAGEELQLLAVGERLELDRRRRDHLHRSAQEVAEGRRDAAIGHHHHVEAGALEKDRRAQMREAAGSGGAVGQRLRPCLHVGDEAIQIVDRQIGADSDDEWTHGHDRDRREVPDRIVGDLARVGRNGELGDGHEQQRMTVRLRLRDLGRRNGARGADNVLDDERLPERAREALRGDTRKEIGDAAGRKRDHERDRSLRPIRRIGRGRPEQHEEHEKASQHGCGSHVCTEVSIGDKSMQSPCRSLTKAPPTESSPRS